MIPQNIEVQVQKVAAYFAQTLPDAGPDDLPETPTWLTAAAESWIRQNYFEFSDLVVAAKRDEATTGN
jgi:hypothetical protein